MAHPVYQDSGERDQQSTDVVDNLAGQVASHLESGRRMVAIKILGALDVPAHAAHIACGLSDPDTDVRLCALGELGKLERVEAAKWVRDAIDDPVAAVRSAARRLNIKPV